jgi:hypothetical protein
MRKRSFLPLLVSAASTTAALLAYGLQPRSAAARAAVVPIQDAKTIDFSSGTPMVRDSAADKAVIDAAVREMADASRNITFPASAPQKK